MPPRTLFEPTRFITSQTHIYNGQSVSLIDLSGTLLTELLYAALTDANRIYRGSYITFAGNRRKNFLREVFNGISFPANFAEIIPTNHFSGTQPPDAGTTRMLAELEVSADEISTETTEKRRQKQAVKVLELCWFCSIALLESDSTKLKELFLENFYKEARNLNLNLLVELLESGEEDSLEHNLRETLYRHIYQSFPQFDPDGSMAYSSAEVRRLAVRLYGEEAVKRTEGAKGQALDGFLAEFINNFNSSPLNSEAFLQGLAELTFFGKVNLHGSQNYVLSNDWRRQHRP